MKTYNINGEEISGSFFSKAQKADDVFVRRSERVYKRFQKALRAYNEFKKKECTPVVSKKLSERKDDKDEKTGGKGVTIFDIPRKRRVKIKKPLYTSLNEFAQQAKAIIDKKILDLKEKMDDESKELLNFLSGMFIEKKKLVYGPGIALFVKMNIKDKDLKKAQELLGKSMESDFGSLCITVEEKMDDGSWRKVE